MKQLEAIRLGCLDKGVDLELILQQWQVNQPEELDGASGRKTVPKSSSSSLEGDLITQVG